MKGCIQMGAAPDVAIRSYMAPADWVAAGIVELSAKPGSLGHAFHMVHPEVQRTDRIFQIVREAGYAFDVIPYAEWRRRLTSIAAAGGDNALVPFLPILGPGGFEDLPELDSRNTTAGLATSGLAIPDVERRLWPTYLAHFVRTGFMPPPASRRREATTTAPVPSLRESP
jgi:thioester reductase-like protein